MNHNSKVHGGLLRVLVRSAMLLASMLGAVSSGSLRLFYGAPATTPSAARLGRQHAVLLPDERAAPLPRATPVEKTVPAAVPRSAGSQPVVLVSAEASAQENAPLAVADRVMTLDLYSGKLRMGVLWLYLYPEKKIARRVFKVLDKELAKALRFEKYYYEDVLFDASHGCEQIMQQFQDEVRRQLDKRTASKTRSRIEAPTVQQTASAVPRKAPIQEAAKLVPPAPPTVVSTPVLPQPVASVKPVETPVVIQAPVQPASAPAVVVPTHKRQVQGDVYKGVVTQAGLTQRSGKRGPYSTFCLTLHDGAREIPLFGAELARQVSDQGIAPGERVQVVFMGQQPIPNGSGESTYKNLYQVTRVAAQ